MPWLKAISRRTLAAEDRIPS